MSNSHMLCSFCRRRRIWMLGVKVLAFILNMLTFAQQINKSYWKWAQLLRMSQRSAWPRAREAIIACYWIRVCVQKCYLQNNGHQHLSFRLMIHCIQDYSFILKINLSNRITMDITMCFVCWQYVRRMVERSLDFVMRLLSNETWLEIMSMCLSHIFFFLSQQAYTISPFNRTDRIKFINWCLKLCQIFHGKIVQGFRLWIWNPLRTAI